MRRSFLVVIPLALAGCGDGPATERDTPRESAASRVDQPEASASTAFNARFERLYRDGWADASAGTPDTGLRLSPTLRNTLVQAFLRDYRPLERATRGELRAMLESGDAFREVGEAMSTLELDADDLVDILAMHHAVHWAVVNRDRVRREQLPAIRQAVASSALLAGLASDDALRQEAADVAVMLTAIRSREYVALRQAGDTRALREYGEQVAAEFVSRHGIDLREGDVDRLPPLRVPPARY